LRQSQSHLGQRTINGDCASCSTIKGIYFQSEAALNLRKANSFSSNHHQNKNYLDMTGRKSKAFASQLLSIKAIKLFLSSQVYSIIYINAGLQLD